MLLIIERISLLTLFVKVFHVRLEAVMQLNFFGFAFMYFQHFRKTYRIGILDTPTKSLLMCSQCFALWQFSYKGIKVSCFFHIYTWQIIISTGVYFLKHFILLVWIYH